MDNKKNEKKITCTGFISFRLQWYDLEENESFGFDVRMVKEYENTKDSKQIRLWPYDFL